MFCGTGHSPLQSGGYKCIHCRSVQARMAILKGARHPPFLEHLYHCKSLNDGHWSDFTHLRNFDIFLGLGHFND